MNSKFQFDKKTGTMVLVSGLDKQSEEVAAVTETSASNAADGIEKPVFANEKGVDVSAGTSARKAQPVRMKRVDKPTPVQLVTEAGVPEAYLDAVTDGVLLFRDRQDYDICQITDERSGRVLAYIGGYALQINFNMAELDTPERVEQCLRGIAKLFRHKITAQASGGKPGV